VADKKQHLVKRLFDLVKRLFGIVCPVKSRVFNANTGNINFNIRPFITMFVPE